MFIRPSVGILDLFLGLAITMYEVLKRGVQDLFHILNVANVWVVFTSFYIHE